MTGFFLLKTIFNYHIFSLLMLFINYFFRCVVNDRIILSLNKSKRKQNPYNMNYFFVEKTIRNIDWVTNNLNSANYVFDGSDILICYNTEDERIDILTELELNSLKPIL